MRLIDADALKFDIMCVYGSNPQYINWLNHAPTVDAVPVRHGQWIDHEEMHPEWNNVEIWHVCSECGYETAHSKTSYCPSCGARMDEE